MSCDFPEPDTSGPTDPGEPAAAGLLAASSLGLLFDNLHAAGYRVIGPRVRGDAIVLDELESDQDLPFGVGVRLEPGGYRLTSRPDGAAFGHEGGPQSWKQFLHPPRQRMWSMRRADGRLEPCEQAEEPPLRLAFLGVRPCDLRAIGIQDKVLGGTTHPDSAYAGRRSQVLIIAVNCTDPGGTCFCTSMGTGPRADQGYDLLLTELAEPSGHWFVVETGSAEGRATLAGLPLRPADSATVCRAGAAVAAAADRMGRSMPAEGLRDLLAASHHAARWDEVATRCLTCGNCTMACPTCFCTSVEDSTDLSGDHAQRWQSWTSCFELDFSYLHGGPVRASAASRYRQWLTHKLGTWHDQFGSSGCVGCGRCIVWCPVGIDITQEVAALQAEALAQQESDGSA